MPLRVSVQPRKQHTASERYHRVGQPYRRVDVDSEAIYALVFVIALAVALEAFTYYGV